MSHQAPNLAAENAQLQLQIERIRQETLYECAMECERMARHLGLHGAQRCADSIRRLAQGAGQPQHLPVQAEEQEQSVHQAGGKLDSAVACQSHGSVPGMTDDAIMAAFDAANTPCMVTTAHSPWHKAILLRFARTLCTQAVPDGWKLVPVVPTPKMVDATFNDAQERSGSPESHSKRNKRIYAAMISAAPTTSPMLRDKNG